MNGRPMPPASHVANGDQMPVRQPEAHRYAESRVTPEWCPNGIDQQHCDHWWDDTGPCCWCSDDTDAGLSDAAPGRKAGERV